MFKQVTEPGQQRRKYSSLARQTTRLLTLNRHGVVRRPRRPSLNGQTDPMYVSRSRRRSSVALAEALVLSETATSERRTNRSCREARPHREVEPAIAAEREWTTIFDTVALLAALGAAVLLLAAVPAAL